MNLDMEVVEDGCKIVPGQPDTEDIAKTVSNSLCQGVHLSTESLRETASAERAISIADLPFVSTTCLQVSSIFVRAQ